MILFCAAKIVTWPNKYIMHASHSNLKETAIRFIICMIRNNSRLSIYWRLCMNIHVDLSMPSIVSFDSIYRVYSSGCQQCTYICPDNRKHSGNSESTATPLMVQSVTSVPEYFILDPCFPPSMPSPPCLYKYESHRYTTAIT